MPIIPIKEIKNQSKEIIDIDNNINNIDPAFFEYAQTKSIQLRNEIAKRNQALVGYIINKYYSYKLDENISKEDLLQEGAIGLMSAIDGFKPDLGYKFSTYACVPTTTQILTKNGWKYYNELKEDDETLGYNNGHTEWTKINGVVKYDDAPLVRFGDSLWNTLCTPQHKWLMSKNGQVELCPLNEWPDSNEFEWPTKVNDGKEKEYKRPDVQLITSAPYVGGNSPLTPDEASILAWVLSDGSMYGDWKNGNPSGACIIQSKKKFSDKIRNLLKKFNAYSSDVKHGDCISFNIKASVFREIWNKSGLKNRSVLSLVLDLSQEARKSWFQTWHDAEGTQGRRSISQNKGDKLDAIELCAFLEGHQGVHTTKKDTKCSLVNWHMRNRTPRRCVVISEGNSEVWCPNTDLGTWTARSEEGFVFLTGNTWWVRQAINNYILNIEPMIHIPSHVRTANNKLIKKLKEENLIYKDYIENYNSLENNKLMYSIKCASKTKNIISIDDTLRKTRNNSLDRRNPFGNDSLLREILTKDGTKEADSIHDNATIVKVIKSAIEELPSKEKYILLLRFNIINRIPREIREK